MRSMAALTFVVLALSIVITTAAPVITTHPNKEGNIIVAEGSNVTLICRATGGEPLTYQWMRVSGSLPKNIRISNKGRRLTIHNITVSDSGQYYCDVSDNEESVSSMKVQVTVKRRPAITRTINAVGSKEVSIISGNDPVLLECHVTGDDLAGGYWEKLNPLQNLSSMSLLSNGVVQLHITRARPMHSGNYRCVVYSQWGVAHSDNVTLTIKVAPPLITEQPSNVTVEALEHAIFTCKAVGFKVKYEWKRYNSVNIIGNQSTHNISQATPLDSDQYYCIAMTKGGYAFSNNVTLTVRIAPPMFTRQPTNKMITALQDVTFTCEAKGFNVKYEWKRHNGGVTGGRQSTLTISRATPLDSDQYYCVAMTEGGYAFSNNVTLTVNDQLSISATLPGLTVREGGTVQLNATASGINIHNFVYQWKKRSSNSLPNKVTGINGTVLTIPNAHDSDEGKYFCTVTNEWGSSMKSNNIILTVTANALEIKQHPQDQYVSVGQTAMFECFVTGNNSSFDVTWERNGRIINSNTYIIKNTMHNNGINSSLTIENVMVRDSGKYWCKATNADNDDFESTQAELIIIPEITRNPSNVTVLIDQSSQLNCNAEGTKIAYHWTKNNITIPGADSNELNIINITESDEGIYRCVASNKGDTVESYPATVTVYGPPVIEKLPHQIHIILGEELKITCSATNDQDAPMKLTFSWRPPDGVDFNVTTTHEDDSHTATSTLYVVRVTRNHDGLYQCIVSNDGHQSINTSVISTVTVEEQSSPPRSFGIVNLDSHSFQLTWSVPTDPHGIIEYYTVYYAYDNQSIKAVNVTNFTGMYTLDNLRPYTEYHIHVTAVKLIGTIGRLLEGKKSKILMERTLAGVPVIEYSNKSKIILNAINSSLDGTLTTDLPAVTLQHGLFSYLYIIVVTDDTITNTESILTESLLEESLKSHPLFYVAAVVDVSQYVLGKGITYILGAGDNTTDINNQVFYNRKVKDEYHYFFRIFSFDSTPENEVYVTTELQKIDLQQLPEPVENENNDNGDADNNNISVVAIAILAVISVVLVICVILLTIFVFKLKMQLQTINNNKSVQQPSSVPDPTYELVSKPDNDDVNMEKNPAYSVQDTSMLHHYDFISEGNQTKAKQ